MAKKGENKSNTLFARRAQSIIVEEGGEAFLKWQDRIRKLEETGLSHRGAMIAASKEFPCLSGLLQESGVLGGEDDPTPDVPICLGKPATFIENVRWAVAAAGETKMTRQVPTVVPNFTAWYLYEQAIKEPSKFTMLMNTAEGKAAKDDVDGGGIVQGSKKSIVELDRILLQVAQREEQ